MPDLTCTAMARLTRWALTFAFTIYIRSIFVTYTLICIPAGALGFGASDIFRNRTRATHLEELQHHDDISNHRDYKDSPLRREKDHVGERFSRLSHLCARQISKDLIAIVGRRSTARLLK